jgi:hypothetical protein
MSILFKVLGDIFRPSSSRPAQSSGDAGLRVFIGYDSRQSVAYNVLQHSLYTRSSRPVSITPLVLDTLPMERSGLTPFTYSRFLVPWLCNYSGVGLFLDLDMLVRGDIRELFDLADSKYAVQVVKSSQRFEWASAILFNCAHPANAVLTPEYVDDAEQCVTPHYLDWLDESLVGALPPQWNHTIGYDKPRVDASLVHYTQGVPAHPEVRGCDFHDEWLAERDVMCSTRSWTELMGNSVHAQTLNDGRKVPKLYSATSSPGSTTGALAGGSSSTTGGLDAASAGADRDGASERFHHLVELYKDMHQRGDTLNQIPADQTFDGRSLVGQLGTIRDIIAQFGASTVLDYGCGKALAYQNGVRLADGTEAPSVKALWNVDDIRLYDPGYEPYSSLPEGKFDVVVSTDVLEHCPEQDVRWIVGEMFGYADKVLYLTISCRPAVKHLPNGENAHITVKEPQWWSELLSEVAGQFPNIRYFATCYGHGDSAVVLRG